MTDDQATAMHVVDVLASTLPLNGFQEAMLRSQAAGLIHDSPELATRIVERLREVLRHDP